MPNLLTVNKALMLAVLAISSAIPALSLADAADPDESRVVIVRDGGDMVSIDIDDDNLTIASTVDGEMETMVFDADWVQEMVDGAMAGMADAMDELNDMQFQLRMGQDNRVNLSYEDTTVELDLDQIMAQVSSALEVGLSEFDAGSWTHSGRRWNEASEEDLKEELDELKAEMRTLKKELEKLQKD